MTVVTVALLAAAVTVEVTLEPGGVTPFINAVPVALAAAVGITVSVRFLLHL